MEEPSDIVGKNVADDVDDDSDSSSETCNKKHTKLKKIESPPSTTSDSSSLRAPEVRFSGYDAGKAGSDHPHTNALQLRPHRTHNDGVGGCHAGPGNVANCSLDCISEASGAVVENK